MKGKCNHAEHKNIHGVIKQHQTNHSFFFLSFFLKYFYLFVTSYTSIADLPLPDDLFYVTVYRHFNVEKFV